MASTNETVLIIGASDKPDRYSYKAFKMLNAHGHKTLLVHPTLKEVEGHKVYQQISDINEKVHTITMYVNPSLSTPLENELIKLKPDRVIFNPGTENNALATSLNKSGIQTEEACTLVLLSTNQF